MRRRASPKSLNRLGYHQTAKPWTRRKANLTLHRFVKIADKDELIVDALLANAEEYKKIIENVVRAESQAGPVPACARRRRCRKERPRADEEDSEFRPGSPTILQIALQRAQRTQRKN